MKQQQKTEIIEGLKDRLARSSIILLAVPHGLSVAQVTDLRRKVRDSEGEYKIAKNTLTLRAVDSTEYSALSPMLEGQTALVFGYGDPVAVTREIVDYAKKNEEKLDVRGAILDGSLLSPDEVQSLAKLGTMDEMRAKLAGVLAAPGSQLVRLLNEPGSQLARAISARGAAGAPEE